MLEQMGMDCIIKKHTRGTGQARKDILGQGQNNLGTMHAGKVGRAKVVWVGHAGSSSSAYVEKPRTTPWHCLQAHVQQSVWLCYEQIPPLTFLYTYECQL